MTAVTPATTETPTGTRDRILRASLRVIGEDGIAAVSNRRLASEAGVALGSLTYHFPSQTELLRECLLLYVREEVARLNAIADQLRAGHASAPEVAREVERIVADTALKPEQIAELELHLQAARDGELQEASRRCFAAYDDFAAAALEALGVPEPQRHAPTVVALMSGFALRRMGTGERDASGTADALTTLLRGVSAPSEPEAS
ncbi:MAG: TetR/AcrR family transcriptional regulator [Solirubrobacterales bacterium]